MRKLIIAVVLALAPFALWVAGCRQNDQAAAFPKGPEVKNLSRAPQVASRPAAAPEIPAAIDPEVLSSPDQPTFARIRAVMDREAQLSNQYAAPGLFVLPRQDYHEMAALPEPVAVPESVPAPALSSREFWSRPAAPLAQPTANYQQYHDVSAMAPAAPVYVPTPAPASRPILPAPAEAFLPAEGIPGIFMGSDQIDPGPFSLAPPVPGSHELPARLTSTAFDSPSLDDLKAGMAKAAGRRQDPAVPLAWAPSRRAPATGGANGAFPLNDDIRQALAPLPDLSAPAGRETAALPALSAPEARTKAESEVSFMASLADFMPPPPTDSQKSFGPAGRDLYMTDFWNKEPAKPPMLPPLEGTAAVAGPAETPMAPPAAAPEPARTAPPKKVTLLPQRTPVRDAGTSHIDSAVEPPPLKF